MLSYPPETWAVGDAIVRQCGKMLVLDRLLVKMRLSGHRCGTVRRYGGAVRFGECRRTKRQYRPGPPCGFLTLRCRNRGVNCCCCRVLLFSTMTKLLDLLEVYLRWRQLPEVGEWAGLHARPCRLFAAALTALPPAPCPSRPRPLPPTRPPMLQHMGGGTMNYLRIDGSTSLDDRWGGDGVVVLGVKGQTC